MRILFLICLTSFLSIHTKAQWSTNTSINNAISVEGNEQVLPLSVTDGSGGAIIVWNDFRNSSTSHIYAQRIDASGFVQWTTDGIDVGQSIGYQKNFDVVADGFGGAIIAWVDSSTVGYTMYTQRLNGAGLTLWNAGGLAISATVSFISSPSILVDGTGGAIIAWSDDRVSSFSTLQIYTQHINASGITQWTANGIAISSVTSEQHNPVIVSDGLGGAIITYLDFRNGNSGIYAQRINASGAIQWILDGVAIAANANYQYYQHNIVTDGNSGAIISWSDTRTGNIDVYAQRISASGVTQWTPNGIKLTAANVSQVYSEIVSDGAGGVIISWLQYAGVSFDLYAQRLNSSGVSQWAINGNVICSSFYNPGRGNIVSDGIGGAFLCWGNGRIGTGTGYDISAQHINALGVNQWTNNGTVVCNNGGDQGYNMTIIDGVSGAIITWQDLRNSNNDIYAQKLNANGFACTSAPSNPSTISGTNTICSGTSGIYSITNDINATAYNWTLPNGWSGTSTTNSISAIAGANSGTIQVTASNGCGTSSASVISVTVTSSPSAVVTTSNSTLTATTSGASYQWYSCPSFSLAPGVSNNQSYEATTIGDYAVMVTLNGCSNTSTCVNISVVGINELTANSNYLKVFPNPSNGVFVIQSDVAGDFSIINALGESVQDFELNSLNNFTITIESLISGMYVIIENKGKVFVKQKIVVNN